MCEFVPGSRIAPDCVGLEIAVVGGTLSAMVKPPEGAPRMIAFDDVPLLRAVKMARLMANLLHTDVVVVDPLGIWHDWLVKWACDPLPGHEADEAPPLPQGGVAQVAVSCPNVLHAPRR